jgi:DNA repair exonuclease SbcCD ATPase subunit
LLPKAREVWANTPRAVQAEFERFEREIETERETHREARELHENLREYREMAKSVGTDIPSALKRYVDFDKQISADFGQGMAAIARDQGKTAADAVASLIRGLGSTPEQYAKHVLANPQAHQAQQQPQQAQRPANDPIMQEVQALRQQMQEQQDQMARERVTAEIIAPFEAEHPRFAELQGDIAKLLQTDMIPHSLSPAERLEVAYDMAERLKPSPFQAPAAFADPDTADATRNGRKSISGAPGNGAIQPGKSLKPPSIREAILAAVRQHGAS